MSNSEFKVVDEGSESEPWEFYNTWKTVEVTGKLAEDVLRRTGKTGTVTITERHDSWGTCEICGGDSDSFTVSVDGEAVYVAEEAVTAENLSSLARFAAWLEGDDA
jgi:hypothetical protein